MSDGSDLDVAQDSADNFDVAADSGDDFDFAADSGDKGDSVHNDESSGPCQTHGGKRRRIRNISDMSTQLRCAFLCKTDKSFEFRELSDMWAVPPTPQTDPN